MTQNPESEILTLFKDHDKLHELIQDGNEAETLIGLIFENLSRPRQEILFKELSWSFEEEFLDPNP